MADSASKSRVQDIFAEETFARQHLKTLQELANDPEERGPMEETVDNLCQSLKGRGSRSKVSRFKCAGALWALGRFDEAVGLLARHDGSADEGYLRGLCLMALEKPGEALQELESALAKEAHAPDIMIALADAKRAVGETSAAAKLLHAVEKAHGRTAGLLYVRGRCLEDGGEYEGAAECYEQGLKLDPNHPGLLFRLAYCTGRLGDEEESIKLYARCLELRPTYVNACLNLGILYEDQAKYERAIQCYRRIIHTYPNHPRARLYLKDAVASLDMYYDEEQERRADLKNRMLNTPLNNFELSVRSRNCLERMGFVTLGDLTRATEAQLLSCKNFGETSLTEIKKLMGQHGLRLGEALEAQEEPLPGLAETRAKITQDVLSTPIAELNLSIRGRRCLERLNINTLGDLVSKSDAELLACKNFGQRSLLEIKQRLSKYGLKLREEVA